LFFILVGVAIVFQLAILKFYNRYDQIANMIREPDSKEQNSTSIRLNIWKISADLISEHPVLGVGTGDLKEELVRKYEEYNYEYGIRTRISPHNQVLHTAVILGLLGVLSLLLMLGGAFVLAWKNRDWLYLLFIVIVFLNCMTESILERQAGILFFAFMNSLFASRYIGSRSHRTHFGIPVE
jgi:O-antigen ligase